MHCRLGLRSKQQQLLKDAPTLKDGNTSDTVRQALVPLLHDLDLEPLCATATPCSLGWPAREQRPSSSTGLRGAAMRWASHLKGRATGQHVEAARTRTYTPPVQPTLISSIACAVCFLCSVSPGQTSTAAPLSALTHPAGTRPWRIQSPPPLPEAWTWQAEAQGAREADPLTALRLCGLTR